MEAATAVFMACCLPFLDRTITFSWQSFAAIGLLCLSKILEFKLSAIILDEISAFELKAWLGITLFMSYATDFFLGEKPSIFKFLFIVLTVAGLVFIAKSGRTDSGNCSRIKRSYRLFCPDNRAASAFEAPEFASIVFLSF